MTTAPTSAADAKRDQMAALIQKQPTRTITAGWAIIAAQWVAATTEDHLPYLITMNAIETELLTRGIPLCPECGGPDGHHITDMHES